MSKISGFTLIELIIVMAIAAIVTTVAVPSFTTLVKNNRATSQANELLGTINLARSEAVKRGLRVTMCPRTFPRTTPETCSNSTNWATGALVFSDQVSPFGAFNVGDTILTVMNTPSGSPTLTSTGTSLQYFPSGESVFPVTLALSMIDCEGKQAKEIEVTISGRGKINPSTC